MNRIIMTTMLAGLLAVGSFAQVNPRRENQQDRIGKGVQSGQLTPGETANLENRERGINGEVRADKNANGGRLTAAERRQVNRQQNNTSRAIYRDKHNAAQDHFGNSEVGRREQNQQQRIGQGIESGHLKAGQTASLENREAGIKQEVNADRRANGGRLTTGEKRQVNRQQNGASRAIYRDKH